MQTSSLAFPNLFDVARNQVNVLEDSKSVVNRSRLLMLSDPTSLYNEPEFGVGLSRYLFQYNTDNQKAIIERRIVDQLRTYEPSVIADDTTFSDGLISDTDDITQSYNKLKLTCSLKTVFNDDIDMNLSELQSDMFDAD